MAARALGASGILRQVQPIGPEGARPAAPGAVQAMGFFQLRGGALFSLASYDLNFADFV